MKSLFIFLLVSLLPFCGASAAPRYVITIITVDNRPKIVLSENIETGLEGLEGILRTSIETFGAGDGEPILIVPDEHTSFATVFAVIQRLKAAGSKKFEIVAKITDKDGKYAHDALVGTTDQIRRETKRPPELK